MDDKWKSLTGGCSPRSIRTGCIWNTHKLLMLGPHPDDFDAIGVTLKLLSGNGNPLQVVVCSTGSGVEDSYFPGLPIEEKAVLREREQRNSARYFGLIDDRLTFINPENDDEGQVKDTPANLAFLEGIVRQKAPDIIFLPHGNDTNSGHIAVYSMIRQIALRYRLPLALLLIRDPKTISMRTDLYLPFAETESLWKGQLLRIHDSQHQRNLNTRGYGFDKRILRHNRQIARELSLDEPYAEAFELEVYNLP